MNKTNKIADRADDPTGWMDTSWTEADARWFGNTMQLRGQILQTDLGRPEQRDTVMERWGLDLSLLAGAGVATSSEQGGDNDNMGRTEQVSAQGPTNVSTKDDDANLERPRDSFSSWTARDFSKQWWQKYLDAAMEYSGNCVPSPAAPQPDTVRDARDENPGVDDGIGATAPTSVAAAHNASPIDHLFQEAMYNQAVLIGRDRESMGKSRPVGLASDEWNDLVRLAGSQDDDDRRELRTLAQTCCRRILFQNNQWPTFWSVVGWSDGPLFPLVVHRLIGRAQRQAALKDKMLEAAAPIQRKVVRAWQQRFQDHRNEIDGRRDQGNREWQAQIAQKVLTTVDDDRWISGTTNEIEFKVRALNGWGHLMLGGGHDNWAGWVDGRRRGLWAEQQG